VGILVFVGSISEIVVKKTHIFWLSAIGVAVMSMRVLSSPDREVQYQIEFRGQAGTTLWGEYSITDRDKIRDRTSEKVFGELPVKVKFNAKQGAIVSASGASSDRSKVAIEIFRNGSRCSNTGGLSAGVSETIVCR
jgi:preprotein translocase subunit SecF